MNLETINKLLKSSNNDDLILGVYMAYTHLGEEWCRNNFIEGSCSTHFPYPCHKDIMISLDTCNIYLGSHYIEYVPGHKLKWENRGYLKINMKINDTNKELSESS